MREPYPKTILLAVCFAVVLAVCAWASDEPVAGSGMRVAIDPETGEFVAAPAPLPFDGAGAATQGFGAVAPNDDLVEEVNPTGGYTIHLQRRYGGVARARVLPSGVEIACDAGESPDHKHWMARELRSDCDSAAPANSAGAER